ncbi:MAG: IreB family regulatory phosphoprotein [Ruminococcaceae bacterium]|nr:IreB family regulatory phosphoprotein [Oscillospiraceae bacterium]
MPNYETMKFDNMENERTKEVREIICTVYNALRVKGYNPVSQIVGYILSGDPTYITNYNNARSIINRVERDEILEEFVKNYLKEL